MKIRKETGLLFFLFIFNLVAILVFNGLDLKFKLINTYSSSKLNYDSVSQDSKPSVFKEFKEAQPGTQKEIRIKFRVLVNSIGEYNNVFQTSAENQGVRLEISKPGNLALVIGDKKIVGVLLTNSLKLNRWYDIFISIDRSGALKAKIDGNQVARAALDTSDFRIDDVAIGTGFSKTRTFDGKIDDFSISYKEYEEQTSILIGFRVILITSFMIILILLLRKSQATVKKIVAGVFAKPLKELYFELRNCELKREVKIKYVTTTITVGFVATVIFFYFRGMWLGMAFPWNTFLPGPVTRFGDYYGVMDEWSRMGFNGVGYGLSYFPSTYLILDVFSHIHPVQFSLFIFLSIFLLLFMFYAYQNLRSNQNTVDTINSVVVCTFMTYPVLFTVHTGNIEAVIFLFLCLFIYLYQSGKFALSSLPLAAIISMKIFPGVFLVLFVADKKYKELLLTLAMIFILSFSSLLIFDGGIRSGFGNYWGHFQASQKMYFDLMVLGGSGNVFAHSLLNGLRILLLGDFPPMQKVLLPYMLFTLFIFTLVSLFIIFVERVFWKRVALLVICMCLLPYTSTDYKLLHFFIPLFLFINYKKTAFDKVEPFEPLYLILFALLLIPKNYYYLHNDPYTSINNILNPMIMIMLLIMIVKSRWPIVKTSIHQLIAVFVFKRRN